MTSRLREEFKRQRHVVLHAVVTEPLLGFLWRHTLARVADAGDDAGDTQVPAAAGFYAEPVMEHLLQRLQPVVEEASGLRLHPTYSYLRLYRNGASLDIHQDRPACEISVSVNLGADPRASWPLWIRSAEGPIAAHLEPGDALLYRGMELEHWREPYTGRAVAQVFLHYVDQAGPCAAWRFDKRDGLALTVPLPI